MTSTTDTLYIYTDGGARGNPGPAAVGVVIKDSKHELIHKFGKTIGKATNNEAEYKGVIYALVYLEKKGLFPKKIVFYLDSMLICKQLSGIYKIKKSHLRELMFKVRNLEQAIGSDIEYVHIPREKNIEADFLLNQALDFS